MERRRQRRARTLSAPPLHTDEAAAGLIHQPERARRLHRKGKHTCRCLNGAPAAETSKHLECRLGTVQCRPGRQLSTSIEFPYRHDIGQILPDGVAVRKIYRGQTFRGLGHDVTFPNGNPPKIRPCNKILLNTINFCSFRVSSGQIFSDLPTLTSTI